METRSEGKTVVDANARELLLTGMSLAERKVDGPLVDQLLKDFAGGLSKSPATRASEPRLGRTEGTPEA